MPAQRRVPARAPALRLSPSAGEKPLPNILIAQHVNAGRLIHVLTDYRRGGVDLSVVLPSGEQIPAAVAAFIDFAAAQIGSMIADQEPQKVRTGKR
jgi:DNA-binding transcriptional LysR family regulator